MFLELISQPAGGSAHHKVNNLSVASALVKRNVSTECSSRHQGESDDWSIQSKRWQVIFQAQVGNR